MKMVHVTIHTACMETSIKFYEEIVGLKPTPIISPNPNVKFFFVEDPNGMTVQFI